MLSLGLAVLTRRRLQRFGKLHCELLKQATIPSLQNSDGPICVWSVGSPDTSGVTAQLRTLKTLLSNTMSLVVPTTAAPFLVSTTPTVAVPPASPLPTPRSRTASPDGTRGVWVAVPVCDGVAVAVAVEVAVRVLVRVAVWVAVPVGVRVAVGVPVDVDDGVGVAPLATTMAPSLPVVPAMGPPALEAVAKLPSPCEPGSAPGKMTNVQLSNSPSGTIAPPALVVCTRSTLQCCGATHWPSLLQRVRWSEQKSSGPVIC